MNSVNLIGYVTGAIDVRYTPNGNPVANFGMATNRRYRQGEDMKQETTFVDLVAFNRTAEIAGEYLGKGRPVASRVACASELGRPREAPSGPSWRSWSTSFT